jgi:hypothetical protein
MYKAILFAVLAVIAVSLLFCKPKKSDVVIVIKKDKLSFPTEITSKLDKEVTGDPKAAPPKVELARDTSEIQLDDKYVPAYYKIQTDFPNLVKRTPRTFDIEG